MVYSSQYGRFVREGSIIWIEEDRIHHKDIARNAGFGSVDDAGQFIAYPSGIAFFGISAGFDTRKDGPARDETIEVAQKTVGDSVKIIK